MSIPRSCAPGHTQAFLEFPLLLDTDSGKYKISEKENLNYNQTVVVQILPYPTKTARIHLCSIQEYHRQEQLRPLPVDTSKYLSTC